ncbi:hypothetical protein AB1I62_03915 [Enterococcus sp. AN402]|uniref:hypothetical protein n=1 Tax=Enterococcus sp. AN402 TaxID=3151386 RepID=UPI0034580D57
MIFQGISTELAQQLIDFARGKREGKAIEINGKTYVLEHRKKETGLRRRDFVLCFRVDRSIIRISNYWSKSDVAWSRNFNCGENYGNWTIQKHESPFESTYLAGKYPMRLLAGRISVTAFRREKPCYPDDPRAAFYISPYR